MQPVAVNRAAALAPLARHTSASLTAAGAPPPRTQRTTTHPQLCTTASTSSIRREPHLLPHFTDVVTRRQHPGRQRQQRRFLALRDPVVHQRRGFFAVALRADDDRAVE